MFRRGGKMKEGGWAFPVYTGNNTAEPGMSLRDYLAGQALAGLLAGGGFIKDGEDLTTSSQFASTSYGLADAMLAEREKGD